MNNNLHQRTAVGKALRINLDTSRYGTFAEIGAGQEVARLFFQAGKASQTIAKTISAYDMTYSDEIYGKETSGRYVCESRLNKMLNHEFDLLIERLKIQRGDQTCFFAFADTVATGTKNCHGWMGVRFQTHPNGVFNDIILHVRMLEPQRLQQQETLGTLGVNLLTAAFYCLNPYQFIDQLFEDINEDAIAIDAIHFRGQDLTSMDEKLINLEVVKKGRAEAILFTPDFKIDSIADQVYGKSLLIQRGKFRPVTNTHLDIFHKGQEQLQSELIIKNNKSKTLPIMEITVSESVGDSNLSSEDFLQRIECLCLLGFPVMITKFKLFYELKEFLRQFNKNPMAIVIGAYHLDKVFDEKYYSHLNGKLLEGLGRLLDENTHLYVYPHKTDQVCMTVQSFFPSPNIKNIFKHVTENNLIRDISGCDQINSYLHSHDVMELFSSKDSSWEKHVPSKVVTYIKNNKFFN